MCGIAGFIDRSATLDSESLQTVTRSMTGSLQHRGPDDEGIWTDPPAGVALGHRRLSILDLSPEGHQPMQSASGNFVIVFNGEIYNFGDIRTELESHGHRFRGHSDTEVMLAAFEQWGVRESVERFNGMFAFAAWDRRRRTLFLCRDRLGKKPLYYGWSGGVLLFGSELKALRAHPAFNCSIDRNAIAVYLRHGYIPSPYSIYSGISKLPPGGLLTVGPSDTAGTCRPELYWSALDVARRSAPGRPQSDAEALERLESLLRDAVRIRMIADVPLGAFLSGGIDSSVVVGLMQSISSIPVRTFSIGFHEQRFDEAGYARAVAAHLGTDHTELYVTPAECREVVPRLPEMFDEPFADSSQIPTFLVSQLARRSVTVALSGDGGDELFGGYTSYGHGPVYFDRNRRWPASVRRAAVSCLEAVPDGVVRALLTPVGTSQPDIRLRRMTAILGQDRVGAAYRAMMSLWDEPGQIVPGASEPATPFTDPAYVDAVDGDVPAMMLLDSVIYLPDDILVKVDRASMAVSLESRCPILDYRVFEFAWGLPLGLKRRNGVGKWILRELAYKLVPRELLDRPKSGFSVPIADWLRGPLRQWAGDLLDGGVLRRDGWMDPVPVQQAWNRHLSGTADLSSRLWAVLMFQAWLHSGDQPARSATVA
jgi:asparagine synthase (glutamine-hydrolysing)